MPLREYKKKRNFGKTPEPEAEVKKSEKGNIYVIQRHHARHLHYDLRLEMDGVLKSWAIPKEPPLDEKTKRLAVMTEDHPLDYATFEGVIPEGEYGAGRVEIWDTGTFDLNEKSKEKIIIKIHGKKLKGTYALIKLKPTARFKGKNNWLFFKMKKQNSDKVHSLP
ncbi:MAG: 3'-phosphoesterase [Candidatus Altiarchaeales archaeon]|nr:MAG: 3'-phosphoesterase [Candidatus Altiarchaeales archaeon]